MTNIFALLMTIIVIKKNDRKANSEHRKYKKYLKIEHFFTT